MNKRKLKLRWVEEDDGHTLYFITPYYEEIEIARIVLDKNGDWVYYSWETKDDEKHLDDAINAYTAKREAERIIEEYYTDHRNYYDEMLAAFKEGLGDE